jgi:hypothetical protein
VSFFIATVSLGLATSAHLIDGVARSSPRHQESVPDLIAMLRFVSTLGCSDKSWTPKTAVCDWAGVTCSAPNVTGIFDWNGKGCTGTVDLTALPSGMQSVSLNSNSFHGILNFSALPAGLQHLDLSFNGFWGPLDLTMLPSGMAYLNLGYCNFNGTINLSALPSWLYNNGFLMLNNNPGICGKSATDFACPSSGSSGSGSESFLTLPYQCSCTDQVVSCGPCPTDVKH